MTTHHQISSSSEQVFCQIKMSFTQGQDQKIQEPTPEHSGSESSPIHSNPETAFSHVEAEHERTLHRSERSTTVSNRNSQVTDSGQWPSRVLYAYSKLVELDPHPIIDPFLLSAAMVSYEMIRLLGFTVPAARSIWHCFRTNFAKQAPCHIMIDEEITDPAESHLLYAVKQWLRYHGYPPFSGYTLSCVRELNALHAIAGVTYRHRTSSLPCRTILWPAPLSFEWGLTQETKRALNERLKSGERPCHWDKDVSKFVFSYMVANFKFIKFPNREVNMNIQDILFPTINGQVLAAKDGEYHQEQIVASVEIEEGGNIDEDDLVYTMFGSPYDCSTTS
jgi:hypothetical protein